MRLKRPSDGEYRWKSKFFWVPGRFDGVKIWLERAMVRQLYIGAPHWKWVDVCLYNSALHGDLKTGLPVGYKKIVSSVKEMPDAERVS